MRKIVAVALVAMVLASMQMAPASAQKKKKKKPPQPQKIERTFDFTYQCPCIGRYQFGGLTGGNPNLGGGVFPVGAGEIYLAGEAKDASGQPVAVAINQDTDGDGFNNGVGSFCGKTETPMAINEGLEVRVFIGGPDICPGPALGGTITFTLSNMP